MACEPDPTPEEILGRRIAIHRKRGEHDFADALLESNGADCRPRGLISAVRNRSRSGRYLTPSKRKRIIEMLAAGVPQRRIAPVLGLCRWTIWAALRRLKAEVRSMLDAGETPKEIRQRIGDDAWIALERSQSRRVQSLWCA